MIVRFKHPYQNYFSPSRCGQLEMEAGRVDVSPTWCTPRHRVWPCLQTQPRDTLFVVREHGPLHIGGEGFRGRPSLCGPGLCGLPRVDDRAVCRHVEQEAFALDCAQ